MGINNVVIKHLLGEKIFYNCANNNFLVSSNCRKFTMKLNSKTTEEIKHYSKFYYKNYGS